MLKDLRIPYMGSKNKLAHELISIMQLYKPNAKYFYDLFGGGGSISFMALQMGYTVIYNEYDTNLSNFVRYIFNNKEHSEYGSFPREWYKFVTRKKFLEQIKLNTPYAEFCRIVYSFGNNRKCYLFNPELEKIKHLAHNFVVFNCDDSLHKFNMLNSTNIIMPKEKTIQGRRLNYQKQIKKNGKRIDLERLERLQQLERLQRLEQLEQLQRLDILNKSYSDIEIPYDDDDVIIYCDPPYRGTAGYLKEFDIESFDKWVLNNNKTVFISEYNAPFNLIHTIDKICTLTSISRNVKKENLYINRNIKLGQMKLFDI